MNWDAISAVGEIVGATAVVISLIYLAIQIRNQNKETRYAAMHDISVGWREASARFTHSDLAEVFVKSNHDFDSISEAETLQLVVAFAGIFRAWEEAFILHEKGRLDARSWGSMSRNYETIKSSPSASQVWLMRRDQYDEKFRRYVDSLEPAEFHLKAIPDIPLNSDA